MSPRRYDPIGELLDLQERVTRLFEETLAPTRLDPPSLSAPAWAPAADVHDAGDAYVVLLDLPGVDEVDVKVHVEAGRLSVDGVRRDWADSRPQAFHRMERPRGRFARSFSFPEPVDPEGVRARLQDGLLRLEVRKLPADSPPRGRKGHGA